LISLGLGGLVFEAFWNTCRSTLSWTGGRLANHAMNGSAGDAVGLRQLGQTLTLSSVPQDADAIEVEWLATNVTAFELGAAHAGAQV